MTRLRLVKALSSKLEPADVEQEPTDVEPVFSDDMRCTTCGAKTAYSVICRRCLEESL